MCEGVRGGGGGAVRVCGVCKGVKGDIRGCKGMLGGARWCKGVQGGARGCRDRTSSAGSHVSEVRRAPSTHCMVSTLAVERGRKMEGAVTLGSWLYSREKRAALAASTS